MNALGSASSIGLTKGVWVDDLGGAGRPASGRAGRSCDDDRDDGSGAELSGPDGLAVASFLARYREPTLTAYTQDLW